jgi:uroporphyrinogen-III synthase
VVNAGEVERGLQGKGVLVTRAVAQAEPLAAAIRQAGGRPILLPALEIESLAARPPSLTADWIIFISPNAVRHGLPQVRDLTGGGTRVAAIGPATARALFEAGIHQILRPKGGFDSESLLALETFAHMHGQQVLIVRGKGGRSLLGDTLRARGASVSYVEVYERRRPALSDEQVQYLEERWAGGAVSVVTCLSVETLENLLELLSPRGQRMFAVTPLVAVGSRVLDRAKILGHKATGRIAAGPEPADIVETVGSMARDGLI